MDRAGTEARKEAAVSQDKAPQEKSSKVKEKAQRYVIPARSTVHRSLTAASVAVATQATAIACLAASVPPIVTNPNAAVRTTTYAPLMSAAGAATPTSTAVRTAYTPQMCHVSTARPISAAVANQTTVLLSQISTMEASQIPVAASINTPVTGSVSASRESVPTNALASIRSASTSLEALSAVIPVVAHSPTNSTGNVSFAHSSSVPLTASISTKLTVHAAVLPMADSVNTSVLASSVAVGSVACVVTDFASNARLAPSTASIPTKPASNASLGPSNAVPITASVSIMSAISAAAEEAEVSSRNKVCCLGTIAVVCGPRNAVWLHSTQAEAMHHCCTAWLLSLSLSALFLAAKGISALR